MNQTSSVQKKQIHWVAYATKKKKGSYRFLKLSLSVVFFVGLKSSLFSCGSSSVEKETGTTLDAGGDATSENSGSVFTPPSDPGKGGILVTVSGEAEASQGFLFTPDEPDSLLFVDGWEVQFKHILMTFADIRLNDNPDKNSANPENVGMTVAIAKGPFAVDLVNAGSLIGKSGDAAEKTVAIAAFSSASNGKSFDPTQRYAFSYDTVAASPKALVVNLDDDAKILYEQAKKQGWSMVFSGVASYRGPIPESASVFAKIPSTVKFIFGMKNAASYINCENTDLAKIADDEFPRGIQISSNKTTVAQITMHLDHLFWSKLNVEGSELHFDPIAARSSTYGNFNSVGEVSIDDLSAVDFTGFKTKNDEILLGRSFSKKYTPPGGQLSFDAQGAVFSKGTKFSSYLSYSAAAAGHLNADGLCKIKRNDVP